MKKFRCFLLLIFVFLPCALFFSGCANISDAVIYVTDIKPTSTVGETTTYTVYYSNGQQSIFTVENGKDGENGKDLTIENIKQYCKENNVNFETFLQQYLTVENQDSIQVASAKAIQSAVSVWCEFPVRDYYTKEISVSCGAGVIYKMDSTYSYIITNYHVVFYNDCETDNGIASKIKIFQYGTSEYAYETGNSTSSGYPEIAYGYGAVDAEYIGGALNYDIAILKVTTADLKKYNEHVAAATIAKSYSLAETAIAIGNPESEGISVTSGIISVESENITMLGADDQTQCQFRVMRIDAAVNGGNSGGGLFNKNGELIGIVNAKVVDSQIDNIAYALPYDNVTKVADNLIYYHERNNSTAHVKKLLLGIEVYVENSISIYNPNTNTINLVENIVVNSVNSNMGAKIGYLMGLEAGDVIKSISINGQNHSLNRMHEFGDWLLTVRPGDKILITIERNNITQKVGITSSSGILESQLTIVE